MVNEGEVSVRFALNGRDAQLRAEAEDRLLDSLRDDLGCVSVREGCGIGVCGSCTVLLDGVAVSSCLQPTWLCDGKAVETLEGMGDTDGGLGVVQAAFEEESAYQCSFCTPGFIMMVGAAIRQNTRMSETELIDYLSGNICRCGSYSAILRAAERVVAPPAGIQAAGDEG